MSTNILQFPSPAGAATCPHCGAFACRCHADDDTGETLCAITKKPAGDYPPAVTDRNEAIARIRAALKRRTGKSWSVTGGTGTAWGWIKIDSPPKRRTWKSRPLPHNPNGNLPGMENWEDYDSGEPGGYMSPAERAALGVVLGLDRPAHRQGVSIPASSAYYTEYVDRVEGRAPRVIGEPYWD